MHLLFVRSACGIAAAAGLALLSLGLGARPAQAQGTPDGAGYYTYTLNDVAFGSSNGTAGGYFDYDPATGAIGNFNITATPYTAGGDSLPGFDYTNADATADSDDVAAFTFENDDYRNSLFLQASSEVNGSGPYNLSFTQETETDGNNNQYYRNGSTGTISGTPVASAVPELSPAAAIGLLGVLGMSALGLARIKTRRVGSPAA